MQIPVRSRSGQSHSLLFTISLVCLVASVACNKELPPPRTDTSYITAVDGASQERGEAPTQESAADIDYSAARIEVDESDSVVSVATLNLDLDATEEQVLALKARDDIDAPIRVLVVAFDRVWDTNRVVFEADTKATNPRAFSLFFGDLVGDHNIEIVARGINRKGEQTLTVFRKATSPQGFGLYYEEICAIAVDGSIEILELDRGLGYARGQTNGQSYPIVTLSADPESDNMMDLVRRTYYWRFETNRYVEESVELIPGETVREQQLRELYRQGTDAFERFLEGSWYLSEGATSGSSPPIVHFDRRSNLFVYFTGDLQESYNWASTHKFLANRVVINGENEFVSFIRKQFYVQVDSLDVVRILQPDPWQGVYRRLSDEGRLGLQEPASASRRSARSIRLEGVFVGDTGNEIAFDSPYFTLEENGRSYRGGYSVYDAGAVVLELKILDNAGLVAGTRRYALDYFEERRENRFFRTILLVPGFVGIYGFEPSTEATSSIRYEQIEIVEE